MTNLLWDGLIISKRYGGRKGKDRKHTLGLLGRLGWSWGHLWREYPGLAIQLPGLMAGVCDLLNLGAHVAQMLPEAGSHVKVEYGTMFIIMAMLGTKIISALISSLLLRTARSDGIHLGLDMRLVH